MRWLALPLLAALLLTTSGFLDSLERTLEASSRLAESSEEAPQATRDAASEVGSLPGIARLTEQQAQALDALTEALNVSAGRVSDLETSLEDQIESIRTVESDLGSFPGLMGCVRGRLSALLAASEGVPNRIDGLSGTLRHVVRSQNKSIRHLKSINRKLTALEIAAAAQGVKPPPPPTDGEPPGPGAPEPGRDC